MYKATRPCAACGKLMYWTTHAFCETCRTPRCVVCGDRIIGRGHNAKYCYKCKADLLRSRSKEADDKTKSVKQKKPKQKKPKKQKTTTQKVKDIATLAAEAGMSYGKYVAKYGA